MTSKTAALALVILLPLLLPATARADDQLYDWHNVRIIGAKVTGIVFHPTARDDLYVRTATSGAYRWDPATKSWICITDWVGQLDWNYDGIESLALDPSDPDRVYLAVGTYTNDWAGHGAMLRSTDRGVTWQVAPTTFKMGGNEIGNNDGERLVVDPNNGKILFFGSRANGLWKSADSGLTWTRVPSFPTNDQTDGIGITFVTFQQQAGLKADKPTPVLFAAVSSASAAIYQSKDAGATWQPVPNQPTGLFPHRAAWDSNKFLFITYGSDVDASQNTSGAVWKLDANTCAWTDITPLHPWVDDPFGYGGIAVDPQHPSILMASTLGRKKKGDDLFRSTDGGKTWNPLGTAAQRDSSIAPWLDGGQMHAPFGPSIAAVAIDPFNAGHVLCTAPWGLYNCADITKVDNSQPTHWTIGSVGIEGFSALRVISPADGALTLCTGKLLDGFRNENVDVSPPAGIFKPMHGRNMEIESAAANPNVVVRLYEVATDSTGGAYSTDNGVTWTEFPTRPKKAAEGTIALSADGAIFVWSPADGPSYSTRDQGKTWKLCKGLPPNAPVVADSVTPTNFYAFDHDSLSVFASTDGGLHFTKAATDLPDSAAILAAAPGLAGHLWLGIDKGIMRSTDAGQTFTALGLVQDAQMITFGKAAPDATYPSIYVWGRINDTDGLFRSNDEGANWVRITDDTHKFGAITSIAGDLRTYGRVYIGSANRGVIYGDPAPLPPPKVKN
jgi:photosystem II stability/assembly factor-like uncharacterized protein